jgi:transporter family-2 protein
MSRGVAIVISLGTGFVVGLQPPANAALSRHVGDLGAALVSVLVTLVLVLVVFLILGHPSRLRGLSGFRPEWAIGGIGTALVVAVGLVAVRPLGAGAVVALLVASQLIAAVAADRLGWFGLHHVGLTPGRIAGLLLVIGGTLLVTRT